MPAHTDVTGYGHDTTTCDGRSLDTMTAHMEVTGYGHDELARSRWPCSYIDSLHAVMFHTKPKQDVDLSTH